MEVKYYSPQAMAGILTSTANMEEVTAKVMESYKITSLNPSSRKQEFVEARQLISYIAYYYFLETTTGAGKRIGKDHSTITTSNRHVKNLLHNDKQFRNRLDSILWECGLDDEVTRQLIYNPENYRKKMINLKNQRHEMEKPNRKN